MEQLIWNALIEKEKDHKDDKTVDNNDSDNDDRVERVNGEKNNLSPFTVTPDKNINNTMTDMSLSYSLLSKALGGEDGGILDPTNPSVQKSMKSLLRELNALLSTTFELHTTDMSNNKISYVRVPRTSSDNSFLNSNEWVDAAIQIAGSKHNGTYEAAYQIANHLLRFIKTPS